MQIIIDIHYLIKIASPFRSQHFSTALPINFTRQSPHNDNQFLGNYRSICRRCRVLIRSCTLYRRAVLCTDEPVDSYVLFSTATRASASRCVCTTVHTPPVPTHTGTRANVSSHVSSEITSSHIHKE